MQARHLVLIDAYPDRIERRRDITCFLAHHTHAHINRIRSINELRDARSIARLDSSRSLASKKQPLMSCEHFSANHRSFTRQATFREFCDLTKSHTKRMFKESLIERDSHWNRKHERKKFGNECEREWRASESVFRSRWRTVSRHVYVLQFF